MPLILSFKSLTHLGRVTYTYGYLQTIIGN